MAKKKQLTSLGKEIKIRLIEKNMTQVELAELIGTTKQYLNKIISGERNGNKYISKISQVLDIKIKIAA